MNLTLPVSEHIELRILKVSEAQTWFDVTRKNDKHLRQWFGWLDDDKSVIDVEKYIEESDERFLKKEGLDLSIWDDNQLIGVISLFPWDNSNKKTSIAYWLTEESQGKGIMTVSLKKVIDYIFTEMKLNRIEINCAVGNTRSSALPKKLGFTLEGIAREAGWLYDHFVDLEVYSLLAKEWKK
jgi:ribosomal-protein-serine acetyltransferase